MTAMPLSNVSNTSMAFATLVAVMRRIRRSPRITANACATCGSLSTNNAAFCLGPRTMLDDVNCREAVCPGRLVAGSWDLMLAEDSKPASRPACGAGV